MYPVLLHIWGPIAIHSYGACIALGALIGLYFAQKDRTLIKHISPEELLNSVSLIVIAGIIGGRLLHIAEYWNSIHSFFNAINITDAGFSLLGTIIASTITLIWYLHVKKLSALNIIDRIVIYIPLVYGISRLGCFFAGCCYGIPTDLPWALTYSNSDVVAPCHIPLHPTQLYSALGGFLIFIFMYYIANNYYKKTGQLFGIYFFLTGFERLLVDFLRSDRIMITKTISTSQMIALFCIILGIAIFIGATHKLFVTSTKKKS